MEVSFIYSVFILIGVFLIGYIPAKIAEEKDRSFGLFFVFGLFCFVPAMIVAICIGNKYDDEKASGKGIFLAVMLGITVLLTPKIVTWLNNLSIVLMEEYEGQPTNQVIVIAALVMFVLSVLLAFLVGALVAFALKKPIFALANGMNSKNTKQKFDKAYNGHPNKDVLQRMDKAMAIMQKRKGFYKKLDRYASYEKLSVGKVLTIALPIACIVAEIVSFVGYEIIRTKVELQELFTTSLKLWFGTFGIAFLVCGILSKMIAKLIVKRAKKLEAIDIKRGYTIAINNLLPEFPAKDYRIKRARIIKVIFRLNITDNIGMADYYADKVEKGVKLAKIAAAVAIPIVIGVKTAQTLNKEIDDSFIRDYVNGYNGYGGGYSGGTEAERLQKERDAKKEQKALEAECYRTDQAYKDAEVAYENGYVDKAYVDKMWKEREEAARNAGWSPNWW